MSENITNIAQANQRIGALEADLKREQETRTAAQTDLDTAKADHAAEIDRLKGEHSAELERLKGEHATEATRLHDLNQAQADKITSLEGEVETLKSEAQTAADQAAGIVGRIGGEAVGTDDATADVTEPATEAELAELYKQQAAIPGAKAKSDFYFQKIKPRLAR